MKALVSTLLLLGISFFHQEIVLPQKELLEPKIKKDGPILTSRHHWKYDCFWSNRQMGPKPVPIQMESIGHDGPGGVGGVLKTGSGFNDE